MAMRISLGSSPRSNVASSSTFFRRLLVSAIWAEVRTSWLRSTSECNNPRQYHDSEVDVFAWTGVSTHSAPAELATPIERRHTSSAVAGESDGNLQWTEVETSRASRV